MSESQLMINDPDFLASNQAVGISTPPIGILSNRVERKYRSRSVDHGVAYPCIWRPDRISASNKPRTKRNPRALTDTEFHAASSHCCWFSGARIVTADHPPGAEGII